MSALCFVGAGNLLQSLYYYTVLLVQVIYCRVYISALCLSVQVIYCRVYSSALCLSVQVIYCRVYMSALCFVSAGNLLQSLYECTVLLVQVIYCRVCSLRMSLSPSCHLMSKPSWWTLLMNSIDPRMRKPTTEIPRLAHALSNTNLLSFFSSSIFATNKQV